MSIRADMHGSTGNGGLTNEVLRGCPKNGPTSEKFAPGFCRKYISEAELCSVEAFKKFEGENIKSDEEIQKAVQHWRDSQKNLNN